MEKQMSQKTSPKLNRNHFRGKSGSEEVTQPNNEAQDMQYAIIN